MIYEPNETPWPPGALVIHDADAKRAGMLMRVIGIDPKTGEYMTRYVERDQPRTIWRNARRYLHAPARFGIPVAPCAK
jgi:hypothetical protein